MAKKDVAVISKEDQDALDYLDQSYPVESTFTKVLLPRLSFASQDQTEEIKNAKTGKKEIKIITEAGTFTKEHQTEELDKNGKKVWQKEEIGDEIEVVILYERKQLKFYDGKDYTSSPVYDADDQVLPLFYQKAEIDRGTPTELKNRNQYQGKSAKGKDISKLEENRILYVLYKGEVYQMNLRGTSMYAFMTYKRSLNPSKVLTIINSEAKENGAISWNQNTFKTKKALEGKELQEVAAIVQGIKSAIDAERLYFASRNGENTRVDEDYKKLG